MLDEADDDVVGEALEVAGDAYGREVAGPAAAPIRLLPTTSRPDGLPDALDEPDVVPFGLRQDTMAPALLDLGGRDQHLLVLGDTRCGKTTVLRGIVRGCVDRLEPDELVIAVMDIRGDLAGEIPDEYLGGHATHGA